MADETPKAPYRESEGAKRARERMKQAGGVGTAALLAALQPNMDRADELADLLSLTLAPADLKKVATLLKKGVDLARLKSRLS